MMFAFCSLCDVYTSMIFLGFIWYPNLLNFNSFIKV